MILFFVQFCPITPSWNAVTGQGLFIGKTRIKLHGSVIYKISYFNPEQIQIYFKFSEVTELALLISLYTHSGTF